jgi:cytochrome P450
MSSDRPCCKCQWKLEELVLTEARGTRLHVQTKGHEIFNALRRQIPRLIVDATPDSLFYKILNPVRPFLMWWDNRVLRSVTLPYIMEAIRNPNSAGTAKTINGLAVQAYLKEHSAEGEIDPRWAEIAINQLKIFLFAGHDTTSSVLSFAYALLQ